MCYLTQILNVAEDIFGTWELVGYLWKPGFQFDSTLHKLLKNTNICADFYFKLTKSMQ